MNIDYSQIGMDYLTPRLLPPMSCTGYKLNNDSLNNDICFPDNGGPCIYGCGCVEKTKCWRGSEKPPSLAQLIKSPKDASKEGFFDWAEHLICKYPEIKCLKLFGSRKNGTNRPDSDWDVLLELFESDNFNKIARKISYDEELSLDHFAADIWFLRSDGLVIRYKKRILIKPMDSYSGFRHNQLIKNPLLRKKNICSNWFTPLYEEIQNAAVLYERKS